MVTIVSQSNTSYTALEITTPDLFEALGDLLIKRGLAVSMPDFGEAEDGATFTPEGGVSVGYFAQAAAIHMLTLKDFEPA